MQALSAAPPSWDTYRAVVTVAEEGRQFGPANRTLNMKFRITRVRQQDSTWNTTIEPLANQGVNAARAGQQDSTERGAVSRIEITDGRRVQMYNKAGVAQSMPDRPVQPPLMFGDSVSIPKLSPVKLPSRNPNPRSPTASTDWSDGVYADAAAGRRALARYGQQFATKAMRDGGRLRYSRSENGRHIELEVDSLTGAILEVLDVNSSSGDSVHVSNTFEWLPSGAAVLRQTRIAHANRDGKAPPIVTTTTLR
jgi:hypothetical protein